MQNVELVKGTKTDDDLQQHSPDLIFTEAGVVLLMLADLLEQIAVVRELHHQTIHHALLLVPK
jgi:hypothetical protein